MYCKNCGNELQDHESFCSKCGVKAGDVRASGIDIDLKDNLQKGMGAVQNGLAALGEHKKTYIGGLACLLISMLVIRQDMFEISYTVFYTNSTTVTLFEDMEVLGLVFILGYIAAAAAMLIPLVMNKEWKADFFKLGKYVPIAAVAWFLIVILKALNTISEEMGGFMDAVDLTTELTVNAWILLIASAGAVLLVHRISKVPVPSNENTEPKGEEEREAVESEEGMSHIERDLERILGKRTHNE